MASEHRTRVWLNGQKLTAKGSYRMRTLAPVTQVVKVGTAKPHMVPNVRQKQIFAKYRWLTDEPRKKIKTAIREKKRTNFGCSPNHRVSKASDMNPWPQFQLGVKKFDLKSVNEETLTPVAQIVKFVQLNHIWYRAVPKADVLPGIHDLRTKPA